MQRSKVLEWERQSHYHHHCPGEDLNCEQDALRPPFCDLLGSLSRSPSPLWAALLAQAALALAGPIWLCPKSPLGREKVEPLFGQLPLLAKPTSHAQK